MNQKRPLIAFWLAPDGSACRVGSTHILYVIDHPYLFGLTLEGIRKVYVRHDEFFGEDGLARDEIVAGLVTKGWVRLRRYTHGYEFTVRRLDKTCRQRLKSFAAQLVTAGIAECVDNHPLRSVKLTQLRQARPLWTTIGAMAEGTFAPASLMEGEKGAWRERSC